MPLHSPPNPWRGWRLFFKGVMALGVVLALWAFAFEPASFRVRNTTLTLETWPPALDGVRVAVLADLHVGSPWKGRRSLERIVREVNEARPDLVLIAGDLVIQGVVGGRFVSPEASGEILTGLEAPLGVYAVLGNHDWWLDGPRVIRALEASGVTVLEDTSAAIPVRGDTLWLAGVSDYWESLHDIGRALSNVPPEAAPLVFTHNPDIFPEMPSRVALTIAGHTHGGQVAFPLLGAPIVPSEYGDRYASGHIRERGRDLFVSTGVGTSILPVRFGVPPEVHVLTLRSPTR